jgi:pilus assembly protein CpaB
LTAGTVVAVGTSRYLQAVPETKSIDTRPVVVATTNLHMGAEIKAKDVRVVEWPAAAVPSNAFANPADAIGRGVVAPIVSNEPLLQAKLASPDGGTGLTPAIPRGLRALSVKVNEVIGVAGYVLPGTRVDVVATVSPTLNQVDMTSKVILTNVPVLASGTRLEGESDKGTPVSVTVVTLLVDPEQAEKLTLASSEGKIQLALRNPLDTDTPQTRGIRPMALLSARSTTPQPARPRAAAAPTVPAPAVEEPLTVEIIRGDKRSREFVQ